MGKDINVWTSNRDKTIWTSYLNREGVLIVVAVVVEAVVTHLVQFVNTTGSNFDFQELKLSTLSFELVLASLLFPLAPTPLSYPLLNNSCRVVGTTLS